MRRLEFENTQGISLQYELASGGERFLAWLIDVVTMYLSILIMIFLVDNIFRINEEYLYFLVVVPILFFYTLCMEIFNDGKSLGKLALGLKVIRVDGLSTRPYDYFMRWMFRWLDIYASSGAFAILTISATPRSQRLGDLLADTTVIRTRNSRIPLRWIDKLAKLSTHKVKFPEVEKLNEEQVLMARTTIHRYLQYSNPGNRKALDEVYDHLIHLVSADPKKNKNKLKFIREVIKDYIAITR